MRGRGGRGGEQVPYGQGGACRFDSGVFTLLRSGGTRDRIPRQDACAEFALAQAWIRTMRQRQETATMRSVALVLCPTPTAFALRRRKGE